MTIETNTEELREILQQVYNLPNRNAGDDYDLVIPIDMVSFASLSNQDIGEIDYNAVSNTKAKLENGETVKVLIRGLVNMDSGDNYHANIYPTSVRMAYVDNLQVDFILPKDDTNNLIYCIVQLKENYVYATSYLLAKQ